MSLTDIKQGQRWRLIKIVNRPDVIVQGVNIYNATVRWSYENESRQNENDYEYFIKEFKKISED